MSRKCLATLAVLALLATAGNAHATLYTSDSNIADLTAGVTSYATFSNFGAGDVSSPFTPTSAEIATNGYRVYNGGAITGLAAGNNWILATFSSAVSLIRVFPNIDHYGAAFDGYQYQIAGSNDGKTWTALFDALTVTGSGEPFTLGSFTGTAPGRVNNVLTPGAGPGGTVGYEADFGFGAAYKYYAFGASTEAMHTGNTEQELSGVGSLVPEPSTWSIAVIALAGVFGYNLRVTRNRKSVEVRS
jgi:hypothetical protein